MVKQVSSLLIAILWLGSLTPAQSTFGGIVGAIKDPGGSSAAGAQITLTSLDDQAVRTAIADGNGGFEFVNLKPGHYQIEVHALGFAEYKVPSLQLDARQ